jgi:hypothetical protein
LEQTQAAWLARFNALALPCFLRFFAADATLFSPTPLDDKAGRVEPDAIADYWDEDVRGARQEPHQPVDHAARR